jgi:hypothetical protein
MAETQEPIHTAHAPAVGVAAPQILNVQLRDDEEIAWTWTTAPDGRPVVAGYEIIKKTDATSERSTH